jgi:hypothetical protein
MLREGGKNSGKEFSWKCGRLLPVHRAAGKMCRRRKHDIAVVVAVAVNHIDKLASTSWCSCQHNISLDLMALKPLRLSWLYSGAFGNILNSLLSIGNGENSFHCSSIPVYPKSLYSQSDRKLLSI